MTQGTPTTDEELLERVAQAICIQDTVGLSLDQVTPTERELYFTLARAAIEATRIEDLRQQVERLTEALTPSGSTKAAYHGEFSFEAYDGVSDAGIDMYRKEYVPWDVVKQIMKAIAARAALTEKHNG